MQFFVRRDGNFQKKNINIHFSEYKNMSDILHSTINDILFVTVTSSNAGPDTPDPSSFTFYIRFSATES